MVAVPPKRAGSRGVFNRVLLTDYSEVDLVEFSTVEGVAGRTSTIFVHSSAPGVAYVSWRNPVTGEWVEILNQECGADECTVIALDVAMPYGKVSFQPDAGDDGGDSIGAGGVNGEHVTVEVVSNG